MESSPSVGFNDLGLINVPSASSQEVTILCCECGISIAPNPSYRCMPCLRREHDIASGIPKDVTIFMCTGCDRYLDPPAQWLTAALESKELLSLCLKRLRGLDKVRLVDAAFLYTEAHSKRLKLKLVVQKEVDVGAVLQQTFEVEYTVGHQFCDACHRIEAKDFWKATVQIRQKVNHKRTFYYLEQLMLKHNIARLTSSIKAVHGGLDLFFHNGRDAKKLVDFVHSNVISKYNFSKKLISHDMKSNIHNYKFTYCVDVAPVCKDSAVCLPSSVAHEFGGISRICLVKRVTKNILLIDPNTAQMAEVNGLSYFKKPFKELVSSNYLTKFIVMEMEETNVRYFKGQGHISHKHTVCDVWVQRESEIGTDKQMFCRTHLGNIIEIGDTVMGYDLRNANHNNAELDTMPESAVPDVVLVKKHYGDKSLRNRRRKWKLRSMNADDKNSKNRDYMDFLDDLEEEPEMRTQVNVFHNPEAVAAADAVAGDEGLEHDVPTISVEEMLDELTLETEVMEEEEQAQEADDCDEEEDGDDAFMDAREY